MNKPAKNFQDLVVWQKAHNLVLEIHKTTVGFPKEETYGLTSQLRRAAVSVPTNIVEGSTKRGRVEFGRYLDVSLGSMAELGYLLRFARDVGLLDAEEWAELQDLWLESRGMLWLLYRSVRRG